MLKQLGAIWAVWLSEWSYNWVFKISHLMAIVFLVLGLLTVSRTLNLLWLTSAAVFLVVIITHVLLVYTTTKKANSRKLKTTDTEAGK